MKSKKTRKQEKHEKAGKQEKHEKHLKSKKARKQEKLMCALGDARWATCAVFCGVVCQRPSNFPRRQTHGGLRALPAAHQRPPRPAWASAVGRWEARESPQGRGGREIAAAFATDIAENARGPPNVNPARSPSSSASKSCFFQVSRGRLLASL